VGRHAADNDAGVHPIVAAALQRQAPESLGALRHARRRLPATAAGDGLGWPGSPPDGTGLGWPADGRVGSPPVAADAGALTAVPESPAPRRAGWRRFFGGGGAAAEDPRDVDAA
jgi:hypothetical protein